jgi:hypothetical protein
MRRLYASIDSTELLLSQTSQYQSQYMSPTRLKKILVSCYLERDQLDRLKALSERTGAPMTHYMREGIGLVLDKHAANANARKRKA